MNSDKIKIVLIITLVIINIILLYRNVSLKHLAVTNEVDSVNVASVSLKNNNISQIILKNIKNRDTLNVKLNKPCIIFFFSKDNCLKCINEYIRYIGIKNKNIITKYDTYFVAMDIDEFAIIKGMIDNEMHKLKYYKLLTIKLKDSAMKMMLPQLILVDKKSNIIYSKVIKPDEAPNDLMIDFLNENIK